ncbi:MAG TPA: hypothetical protein PLW02_08895, partial [Verrucomicrobiota bacterium]|nr:hypothetical protein [Verrucomicrobiota bacterium]
MNGNKKIWIFLLAALFSFNAITGQYEDRFVWIFGWGLSKDSDVIEIEKVLKTASENGFNGAIMSAGLDTLCKQNANYFRRLNDILQFCKENKLEFIPAVFSVGYGGGALAHNRQLAEGVLVSNALFEVKGKKASFVSESEDLLENGGFEKFRGNKALEFNFHDNPGVISFIDTNIFHNGKASMRLENFASNPHGHGRIMQELKVKPHRCYLVSVWVKTENLMPANAFKLQVLVKDRSLAPREFNIPETTDWKKISMVFNSMEFESVLMYAGMWEGKQGKLWLDDWEVKEIGPVNVLKRSGTPVTVKSYDGSITYKEGKDYDPLIDPSFTFWNWERKAPDLRLRPNSAIKDGEKLLVSWYHPMVVHESQVTVCMNEPELYEIFDHEAKL